MNGFARLFIIAVMLTPSCLAQTGKVTFYTADTPLGSQLKTTITTKGAMPFIGWLFDGTQLLAHTPKGRFVTFNIPSGTHAFSVSYSKKHPGKAQQQIQLNIESEHAYCVRLSAIYLSHTLITQIQGEIEAVDCQQAFQEAGTTKPLDTERVEKDVQKMLNVSAVFPTSN